MQTNAHKMTKEHNMIEATTNPAARNAMSDAHIERGKMIQNAWTWLFGGKAH